MLIKRCLGWAGQRHLFGFRVYGVIRAYRWTLGISDGMCSACYEAFLEKNGLKKRGAA